MTNYIEQAKEALSDISHDELRGIVEGEIELAKANALIAIAEQLRIANLIGLNQEARVNSPAGRSLYQVDDSQFGSMVKGLQPDIADALGIGGGSDD